MSTWTDEFRITASKPGCEDRVWTRGSYRVAKAVADAAVIKLGYVVAKVINNFGGNLSDILYEVKGSENGSPIKTDHILNEKSA